MKSIFGKSVSAVLTMLVFAGTGLFPVSAYASTIGFQDDSNPRAGSGGPEHVPPISPPFDTPAFYNGLVNTHAMLPANIPANMLPGSGFGQTAVPVPAAAWLFGSGLLGLAGMARLKKTT